MERNRIYLEIWDPSSIKQLKFARVGALTKENLLKSLVYMLAGSKKPQKEQLMQHVLSYPIKILNS